MNNQSLILFEHQTITSSGKNRRDLWKTLFPPTHTDTVEDLQEEVSLAEQVRRIKDIEAIESDSFVPQAFKSSRDTTKVTRSSEIKKEAETATVNEVTSLPTSITYNESNSLAHPSLFMDKEEAENLWLNRLISLRQERLMGSPVP